MNPIYENQWVKLFQGDCLEIMPQLDMKFDACITDPPYGTTQCKWDIVIPFDDMWMELKRLVKPNGAICLFGSEPFSSKLRCSNLEMFKYDWIWEKSHPSNFASCSFQPLRYTENISVFYQVLCTYNPILFKGKKNHNSTSCSYSHNIYNDTIKENINISNIHYPKNIIYQSSINRTKLSHPTQKPVALIEYLIKTYTNEGEFIIDFTAGSGTTGVAAMETNRKAVLIEKEQKYCEITIQRLQDKEKEIAERLF